MVSPVGSDAEQRQILFALQQLVEPLRSSIAGPAEVVLHDLGRLPDSIVAISGSLTGREVGDPATDTLLKAAARDELETHLGYRTTSPDGRSLLSTTIVVRDSTDAPIAALCINRDITQWQALRTIGETLSGLVHDEARTAPFDSPVPRSNTSDSSESFVRDVDELATILLSRAVAEAHLPVDQMRKEHKVEVVRRLKDRGFFLLRDAPTKAAEALHCSRFSIYNYLNEIDEETK